jgi:type II secretory pathway predicted ATPase ExeA
MNDDGLDPNLLGQTRDPPRGFAHGVYASALQGLLEAAGTGPGVLVLIGAAGTGKTTLIADLASRLERDGYCVERVASSRMDTEDLLRLVGFALELRARRSPATAPASAPVRGPLDLCQSDRPAMLIIDEAQDLAPAVLHELCRLAGELTGSPAVNLRVLLSGRDDLLGLLDRPEHAEIRRRILATHRLGPLAPEEMRGYADHALEIAGWTGCPAIGPEALDLIHARTGGVPRLVTLVLGHLLLNGRLPEAQTLGTRDVDAVLSLLGQDHAQLPATISEPIVTPGGPLAHPPASPAAAGLPVLVSYGGPSIGGRGAGFGPPRVGMLRGLTRWGWRGAMAVLSAAVVTAALVHLDLTGDGARQAEPQTLSGQDRGTGYTVITKGGIKPPPGDPPRLALEPLLAPAPLVIEPRPPTPLGGDPDVEGRPSGPSDEGSSVQGVGVAGVGRPEVDGPTIAGAEEPADPEGAVMVGEDPRAARDARIARLLAQAERAMERNRLTVPAGDNAYGHYRAALRLDPGNPEARAGVRGIVTRYQGLAQQRLRKGDLSGARRFAARGLTISPRDPKLLAIKRKATRPKGVKPEQEPPALLARLGSWLSSGRSDRSLFLDP